MRGHASEMAGNNVKKQEEIAMNAVVCCSSSSEGMVWGSLEKKRDRMLNYCGVRGYIPLVICEVNDSERVCREILKERIMQLAEKSLIDIVVFSDAAAMKCIGGKKEFLRKMEAYDIQVECV